MTQITLFDTSDMRSALSALENHFAQTLTGYEALSSEHTMIEMLAKELEEIIPVTLGMQCIDTAKHIWSGYALPRNGGKAIGTIAVHFNKDHITVGHEKDGDKTNYRKAIATSKPLYNIKDAGRILASLMTS